MRRSGGRKSKRTNSRDSKISRDNDVASFSSSLVPGSHVRPAPPYPIRRHRRKTYFIRNMKLVVTYYAELKELSVEISNRYIQGINYDHRFKMAASNTFDEMEALVYMLSIIFGDYPIPREEWISNYFPRQGPHEYQYRDTPVDFKSIADAPRRILFRGNIFQELTPAFPTLNTAVPSTVPSNPMGKGKGKNFQ